MAVIHKNLNGVPQNRHIPNWCFNTFFFLFNFLPILISRTLCFKVQSHLDLLRLCLSYSNLYLNYPSKKNYLQIQIYALTSKKELPFTHFQAKRLILVIYLSVKSSFCSYRILKRKDLVRANSASRICSHLYIF